jgi:hypothetical protein
VIDAAFRSSALAGSRQFLPFRETRCRAKRLRQAILALLLASGISGCAASPKHLPLTTPAGTAADPDSTQFVGHLSRVWGLKPKRVDGVSLVVGLPGSGSDPPPTSDRDRLLSEMQTREVDRPNSILAASSTALVRVRGFIPPGARKGDHFDLFVEAPRQTDTSDLSGGWMMASRLREYAVLESRVAEGHLLALGQGDVLTDALLEAGEDEVNKTRGRVLGGGVVVKERGFGLVIRNEFSSVKTSSRLGESINARFNVYHNGSKRGVANPKRDDYVELLVHPRYEGNEVRYVHVIENIAVREPPHARSARLDALRRQLANPSTAALAAVQLEAIGEDGIPALRGALDSNDLEVRFYAAEALAYQDVPDAVEALDAAVRRQPAFRMRALLALGAMDDIAANEALIGLLHVASAETRYGAFRILRRRTPDDPMIDGQIVNDSFSLHEIVTTGPPLIHVSRVKRPEIVFFGLDHKLVGPVVVFAGNEVVIRSNQADGVTVRRLSAGEEDASVECSRQLIDVIKGIAEVNGTYSDVVHALTGASRSGSLQSRLEFSAIPTAGRTYRRGTTEEDLREDDRFGDEAQPVLPGDSEPNGDSLPVLPGDDEWLPADSYLQPERVVPESTMSSGRNSPSVQSDAGDESPRSGTRAERPSPGLTSVNSGRPTEPRRDLARRSGVSSLPVGVGFISESETLSQQVTANLQRSVETTAPSAASPSNGRLTSQGEVAPLPPDMGPILKLSELIDPQLLGD